MLSGITKNINAHFNALKGNKISLTTNTLTNVLDEVKAPTFIEYLSLDTEGSELDILRGLDLEKYTRFYYY